MRGHGLDSCGSGQAKEGDLVNTVDADFLDWLRTSQLVQDSTARSLLLTAKNLTGNFM
jgi:hypothetical protein